MEYDFSKLTDIDFEEFAKDLLKCHFNIKHMESFKRGQDQGIDLRYSDLGNRTIVQCKHYLKTGINKLKNHLKTEEFPKVIKLNPDRYILFTSVEMSPKDKDEIIKIFSPFIKISEDIFSLNDIHGLLKDYDNVVKKNPKLWLTSAIVLKEVIGQEIYEQLNNSSILETEELIKNINRKSSKYVQTNSFHEALKKLQENKNVIISGNAGIGKTTLAEILILYLLKDGFVPVVITEDIKEARDVFDKNKKQVFYYDDFLGTTFLNSLQKNEDHNIIKFIELINETPNKYFILTTREHILSSAFNNSEVFQQSNLINKKYILKLASYNKMDKARILYNHLFFSEIPIEHLKNLIEDKKYLKIINHRNYSPRIMEWMSNLKNIAEINNNEYSNYFINNLNNPEKIWDHAFHKQISDAAKNLLISMYIIEEDSFFGTPISILKELFSKYHLSQCNKYTYVAHPSDFNNALKELEGSFIAVNIPIPGIYYHNNLEKEVHINYYDPSIEDYIEHYLISDLYNIEDILVIVKTFTHIKRLAGLFFNLKSNYSIKRELSLLEERLKIIYEEIRNDPSETKPAVLVEYLTALIKINSYLCSMQLCNILNDGLSILLENVPMLLDYRIPALLKTIQNCINIKYEEKLILIKSITEIIISIILPKNKTMSSEEFIQFNSLYPYINNYISNDTLDIIKNKLCKYLEDDALYDCEENCRSVNEVDDFLQNLSDIAKTFNLDSEALLPADFEDLKNKLNNNEPDHIIDYDDDNYYNINEAAQIDNMFNSLLVP